MTPAEMNGDICRAAMAMAIEAHHGQTDKSGMPYFHHVWFVANRAVDFVVADNRIRAFAAGLLHDVVEDGHRTIEQVNAACGPRVALAVDYLSYDKEDRGETRQDYIARLAGDDIARAVKLADLEHNMDLGRLDTATGKIRQRDYDRAQRYVDEYAFLLKEHIRRRFGHWVKA